MSRIGWGGVIAAAFLVAACSGDGGGAAPDTSVDPDAVGEVDVELGVEVDAPAGLVDITEDADGPAPADIDGAPDAQTADIQTADTQTADTALSPGDAPASADGATDAHTPETWAPDGEGEDALDGSDANDDGSAQATDWCGDGACVVPDEDPESCPADCGAAVTDAAQCLVADCAPEMGVCQAEPGCNGIFLCLLGCEDDACAAACYDGVPGPAATLMVEALGCAADAGCFGGETTCGDGVCGDAEDGLSCPADCGLEPDCTIAACGAETESCAATAGCQELHDCALACKSSICGDECYLAAPPAAIAAMVALEGCATAAGCAAPEHVCGDGFCEAGEDPLGCPDDCSTVCGDGACDLGETEESCPADCFTATCNGKCGVYDEANECQCDGQCPDFGDCCDDYFALCTDDSECGDGACSDDEGADSCPEDCETGLDVLADALSACIGEACAEQAIGCLGDDGCQEAAACLDECVGVQYCAVQCWKDASPEVQGLLAGLLDCGVTKGCMVIDDLPVCGDGTCEPGEVSPWCADECPDGGGCEGICGDLQGALAVVEACLAEECAESVAPCAADDGCAALGQCLATCQGIQACAVSCYLAAPESAQALFDDVLACGAIAACFVTGASVCGDGTCQDDETVESCQDDCFVPPPGSCDGTCFVEYMAGAECQCDPFCLNYDDCCGDYTQLCLPPCGNGTCDEDESPQTCPSDCQPGWECLNQSCSTSVCEQIPACAGALPCLEECSEVGCADDCTGTLGGLAAVQFGTVVDCGVETGCLIVPGECGNGICEADVGEDADSCAGDCVVFDPLCLPQQCTLNPCFEASGCNALLPCVAACATLECAEACVVEPLEPEDDEVWTEVLTCGSEAGCLL